MADYWVSRKRWTCKYCDITINDDIPSRQQHENGLRHRHNVERALRDMYKKQERGVREKEEAKREMARIERVSLCEGEKKKRRLVDETTKLF